ncbi:MAG: hypothetical protein M0Z76_09800 [Gammaproteobacteria bacterium]|nr:hypothetical protein [Gammaproteobacteria bacterium]
MRKRWIINLVLLMAAGVLVATLWSNPRPHAAPLPKLTSLKPGAVTRLTLQRTGHPTIRLVRDAHGHWRLTAPFAARADRFRAAAVADIAGATVQDHFAAPADLARYGLASPRAVLRLNGVTIQIGARHPLAPLRYVLIGHTVDLISAETVHPARLTVDSFLSTRLLGRHIHARAFLMPAFTVARVKGIWRLTPASSRISNDHINSFVDKWRYARALQVTRYHGGEPVLGRVTIRYEKRAGNRLQHGLLHIDILATTPEVVLLRPRERLAYHFPQEIGERMLHIAP